MIKENVEEIFTEVKGRVLKGRFLIPDKYIVEYLTFFLIGQKVRFGYIPSMEEELPSSSMRQHTLNTLGYNTFADADEDGKAEEIKTIERRNANQYNKLNKYTKQQKEKRQAIESERKASRIKIPKLKESIEIFDFQKEITFLLDDPATTNQEVSKAEKDAKTTLGQLRRNNFEKIRIPHLENLAFIMQENIRDKFFSEEEEQLHLYLVEKNIALEFTKAYCRTIAKQGYQVNMLDAVLYFHLFKLPSFSMREFYLEKVTDLEWRRSVLRSIQLNGRSEQLDLLKVEIQSILNLGKHFKIAFINAGYTNLEPNKDDYDLYSLQASYESLAELHTEYTDKESEVFNKLKINIQELQGAR